MPERAELPVTLSVVPLPMVSVFATALFVEQLKLLIVVTAPEAIVSAPVGSFRLVPVLLVPSDTPLLESPSVPPVPTASVPELIVMPPEKMLLPLRFNVAPAALRASPAPPRIEAEMVGLRPLAIVTVGAERIRPSPADWPAMV